MMVTVDLLRKHKGCEQGIKYIERFYPDGAEIMTLIRDRHINKEFLHWGREHLTVTDEELAAYCEACHIENTDGFWYSQNVRDSKYVVRSKDVDKSRSVFESKNIVNCKDIVNTDDAENSSQIFYSSMIDRCDKVCKGTNIVSSTNICNSTMVARCVNVIDSNTIFDSSEIINCHTVSNSHFCQNCTNISDCLFCEGLTDAEYHIFNKPVDPKMYELFEMQYMKYMAVLLDFIANWPRELVASTYVAPTRKFDDWYHTIPPRFWKWTRTLPGFDGMLLYNITMNPELLIEE